MSLPTGLLGLHGSVQDRNIVGHRLPYILTCVNSRQVGSRYDISAISLIKNKDILFEN